MRVLVTGAAGFIGSHLAVELSTAGHDVVGCDNFDPYYDVDIKVRNTTEVRAAGVEVKTVDVRQFDHFARFADSFQPDTIAHLAAKAGVRNSVRFPMDYVEANVMGTQTVLEAARVLGGCHVVVASTSSVYAGDHAMPFSESYPCVVPLQPYAASKRSAELVASTYEHLYDVSVTVTRLFTVYGPRGRPDMMPMKLARSISHGEEVTVFEGGLMRDWTYVSDIVDGVRRAVEQPHGFTIVNLGRGEPVALDDFIALVEQRAGRSANLRRVPCPESEMKATYADISRARDLIGFDPTISVAAGIDLFWSWYETTL